MVYRWHPWSGRLVRILDVVEKAGMARARCALDCAVPGLWQEIPIWMFDRVAYAGMRVEERSQVDLATLSALASAGVGCAGQRSRDVRRKGLR